MKKNVYFAIAPVLGFALVVGSMVAATAGYGYVSVPAAAFRPLSNIYSYTADGYRVINMDDSEQYWVGHVQLPHGVTVTSVEFFWRDVSSSHNARFDLRRHNRDNYSSESMAMVWSSGAAGDDSTEDTSISYAVIDNTQYTYFLQAILPKTDTVLYGVTIEYTYQTSLSLVLSNF
jgi:hypothetical protein